MSRIFAIKLCCNEGCQKEATLRCSGCDVAIYCCRECRRKHWDVHSSTCAGTLEFDPMIRNRYFVQTTNTSLVGFKYPKLLVYELPIRYLRDRDVDIVRRCPVYLHPNSDVAIVVTGIPGSDVIIHEIFEKYKGDVSALRDACGECESVECRNSDPPHIKLVLHSRDEGGHPSLHVGEGHRTESGNVWMDATNRIKCMCDSDRKVSELMTMANAFEKMPSCDTFFNEFSKRTGDSLWTLGSAEEMMTKTIRPRLSNEEQRIYYETAIYCRVIDFWNIDTNLGIKGYYRATVPPPTHQGMDYVAEILSHVLSRAESMVVASHRSMTNGALSRGSFDTMFWGYRDLKSMNDSPTMLIVSAIEHATDEICVVCHENRANRICSPCNHACLCDCCVSIATAIKDHICPICRRLVQRTVFGNHFSTTL